MRHLGTAVRILAPLLLLIGGVAATPAAPVKDPDAMSRLLSRLCDQGITLALAGKDASAESVFVSLLSQKENDASAFNNLGNLYLLRGEPEVAMTFYGAASDADGSDPGILLNGATAAMLAGENEIAEAMVESAVRRAGGIDAAATFVGLVRIGPDGRPRRTASRAAATREELLELVRAVARSISADSRLRGKLGPTSDVRNPGQAPVWRSTGARGDVSAAVYWKR